jgi:hypothetical protein
LESSTARQVASLEPLAVEVDHHGPDLAAVDQRGQRALLAHDHRPDLISPGIEQGSFTPSPTIRAAGLAVQGDEADRRGACRIVREHDRGECARWHGRELPAGQRIDLGQRAAPIDVPAEVVPDDAHSDDRPGLDPLSARRLDHPSFHPRGDVLLDARGRHPAIKRERLDRRALEHGKDVDRDREARQGPEQPERQGHHCHRDRVAERSLDQSIHREAGLFNSPGGGIRREVWGFLREFFMVSSYNSQAGTSSALSDP